MHPVSVLVIHNAYQQWGGENAVVRAEVDDLRRRGHRVVLYTRDNSEICRYGPARRASLPLITSWNPRTYSKLRALIRSERPDLAHIHNFFPLVSPSAHYACKSVGVPVVQTLHNYRLFCPGATLFWRGQRCRSCHATTAIAHGCYRNSQLQTAVVAAMLHAHRAAGTWERSVDAFLVPSGFCRDYFAGEGLPPEKLHVKPNFLAHDPGPRTSTGAYALSVGRLSPEKGVLEAIRAWRRLRIPLLIAGEGPLRAEAERAAQETNGTVKLLGQLDPEQVIPLIKGARFVIFPSLWYEPFGMGLLEAAACGVPAIASHIGAIPELVRHTETGLLFDPDNFDEMAKHVHWAWSHASAMEQMGHSARQLYLSKFTADKAYEALLYVWHLLN